MRRFAIALALLCSGCASLESLASASLFDTVKLKQQMLSSPLIRLSDVFYPDGQAATAEDIARRLQTAGGLSGVQRDMRWGVRMVEAEHKHAFKYLESVFGPIRRTLDLKIEVEPVAYRTAELREGTIHVDVEVLQAFFKAAVADLYVNNKFDVYNYADPLKPQRPAAAPPRPADDDPVIVQRFIDLKRDIRRLRGRRFLGTMLHPHDEQVSKLYLNSFSMSKMTNRYDGLVLFMIAHETGHLVLGHKTETCTPAACANLRKRELDADRYAYALLSLMVARHGWGIPQIIGYDDPRDLEGYLPFFLDGYRIARFNGVGECECHYPTPQERIANLDEFEKQLSRDDSSGRIEKLIGGATSAR